MSKSIIIAACMLCSLLGYSQSKKLTLLLNKQPITLLFQHIQKDCGYRFVYSDEIISDSMLVSLDANRLPVSEVLQQVLPPKKLFYKLMSEKLIVIGSSKQLKSSQAIDKKLVISGNVSDEQNKSISFASVAVLQNERNIAGAISDDRGNFDLSHTFKTGSVYTLQVSCIGYQKFSESFTYPDTFILKTIRLKEERSTLATVRVTANKPLIERLTDRYVVNVDGSFLANGNSALEVLQKSPGIWIGSDGSIKIKGNQSVMVMINDVVQRMSENDLAEYLRSLRSEDISKIEIIANPPSEFEAAGSGGIIHIVLKKSRQDGLLGTVSSQYRQQVNRPAYNGGVSLNYKLKSLYLSGSISAGKDESDYIANTNIVYADNSRYSSNTDRYNNNSRSFYRIGASYDLNKYQSLGIQSIITSSRMNQFFDTGIHFTENTQPLTGSAHSEWYRKPTLSGTTLNYSIKLDTLGSGLKILGDYIYSTRTELNNFASVYTIEQRNSTYRNNTPNTTELYSLQTDYTKVLKKSWEVKAGLKFTATKRDNEVVNEDFVSGDWLINTRLSNRFIYKEDLFMAYTSVSKSIKNLSIKGGLRAEETSMDGNSITGNETFKRNYLSFFPSIFLLQHLNKTKGSSLFLNYSRRLQRPAFSDLNPYRLQFDDFLTQLGNPDLLPEYTHKIELGTALGKGISADIYYTITTDKIAQLASPVNDNVIEYQNRNFNNSKGYGLSVNAPIKFKPWWSSNSAFTFYNLEYTLGDFVIRQNTLYAMTQHSFTLKNLFNLDAYVDYRSPYVQANTHIAYQFYTDLSFSRRVLNKKVLLRLNISDVLNTARERDYTEFSGTRIDFYQKRPTRTFALYLSYSFSSGKKFSDKKIEQSAEEEKRRIGN